MLSYWLVPTAAVNPPPVLRTVHWHALHIGAVAFMVADFDSPEAEDEFNARPNTVCLGRHRIGTVLTGQPLPDAVVTILSRFGVVSGDTLVVALGKIRATWPAARVFW